MFFTLTGSIPSAADPVRGRAAGTHATAFVSANDPFQSWINFSKNFLSSCSPILMEL